jgi:hypothetical protein
MQFDTWRLRLIKLAAPDQVIFAMLPRPPAASRHLRAGA